MKESLRVLLLEVPQLLRDILEHEITSRSDCRLLKGATHELEPERERDGSPDIVILGLTAAEDCTLVPALFARWPLAQVMTVTQTGDEATVWELRPGRRALGQMSPAQMVNALHAAVDVRRQSGQE